MTVSQARTNIYKIMDETAQTHQPIMITGKRNNVVMLSEEDWNAEDIGWYPTKLLILSKL